MPTRTEIDSIPVGNSELETRPNGRAYSLSATVPPPVLLPSAFAWAAVLGITVRGCGGVPSSLRRVGASVNSGRVLLRIGDRFR